MFIGALYAKEFFSEGCSEIKKQAQRDTGSAQAASISLCLLLSERAAMRTSPSESTDVITRVLEYFVRLRFSIEMSSMISFWLLTLSQRFHTVLAIWGPAGPLPKFFERGLQVYSNRLPMPPRSCGRRP